MATIAVPVRFTLPQGWRPVDPNEAGAPGATFVAVHTASRGDLTANITVGQATQPDQRDLSDIADESLGRLAELGTDVTLARRTTHDSAAAPGLSQLVTFSVPTDGGSRKLVQYQVFLALVDTVDPSRRMVVEAALTVTPEEFDDLATEFGDFVSSIRLDSREPEPTSG